MNEEDYKKLRKDLGIDEYLELIQEDKNLNGGYISLAQYMYLLEHQLEEKDKLINEILSYGWFDGDCPASITGENLNYCENCIDNYKQCWLDYFKNKVKDSELNVEKS